MQHLKSCLNLTKFTVGIKHYCSYYSTDVYLAPLATFLPKMLPSPYLKYSWVLLAYLPPLLPQAIFIHRLRWSRNHTSIIHLCLPPLRPLPVLLDCPRMTKSILFLHAPSTISLQGNSYNSQPCIYLCLWFFISPVLKYHNISAVNWSTLASWVIFIVNLRWHVIVQINGSCESEILSLVMVITFNMC